MIQKFCTYTFNYVSYRRTTEHRSNCTEVYRRMDDAWRIAHTHWSFTQPSRPRDETA